MRALPEKIGRNKIQKNYSLKIGKSGINHKMDLPKRSS